MPRKFFGGIFLLIMAFGFCSANQYHRQNHSDLVDFTCATAKDELEKHPEMRTIAMIELENNFPSDFSAKVLKCLPPDVAKIIINPHIHPYDNSTLMMPKQTMVIYVADKVRQHETLFTRYFWFQKNFPIVHHLSKHLVVSSDLSKVNKTLTIFKKLLNVVQIYEENHKVIAKTFDRTKNWITFDIFESSQRENLSQILFPDKVKNLNGQKLFAAWHLNADAFLYEEGDKPNTLWTPYLDIISKKLNVTFRFIEIEGNDTSYVAYHKSIRKQMMELMQASKLDFYLNFFSDRYDLQSYRNTDGCFIAPYPEPYSIIELILFLPMDKSCWMWLGITIAVSTLIWRISEGHWNFAFGGFSYLMGQAQLIIRIRTNRLAMKILLQILILTFFIFGNGYQSFVTSFMLDPLEVKPLKTIDELFDSNLKIEYDWMLERLYGDNLKYQKAKEDGRLVEFNDLVSLLNWEKEVLSKKVAVVKVCELHKIRMKFWGDGKQWAGVYVIDDVVYTKPEDMYTRPFHPYLEIFQKLMDQSFEAGLHQAWKRLFLEIYFDNEERKTIKEDIKELDFEMIAPSLYILAFGLLAALVALLCEIFWKDFVMELTKEYFERKWKEIFGRNKRNQKVKPNVRRIKVKAARGRRIFV